MGDPQTRIVKRAAIFLSVLCLLWIVSTAYCILGHVTNHASFIAMRISHGLIFGAAVYVLFSSYRRLQALDLARESLARRQAEDALRKSEER